MRQGYCYTFYLAIGGPEYPDLLFLAFVNSLLGTPATKYASHCDSAIPFEPKFGPAD